MGTRISLTRCEDDCCGRPVGAGGSFVIVGQNVMVCHMHSNVRQIRCFMSSTHSDDSASCVCTRVC